MDKAQDYKPDYDKLRFAQAVAERTTLGTGVVVLPALEPRIEFLATLDRVWAWGTRVDRLYPSRHLKPEDGWVILADTRDVPPGQLARAAARPPVTLWGPYAMVDMREEGRRIEAWRMVPEESPWAWRFWHRLEPSAIRLELDQERVNALGADVDGL